MFAKSKRFPEVDKDYIPGPGEYDVGIDDGGKHKRYGFLTQSDRFSEEHTDDDGYFTSTISSEMTPKKERSIQKECEALIMKHKRMETTIEILESEKKTIQLEKDMELADVRSKNAALQKTMARQEKQIKGNIWQKKIEQLTMDNEKRLLEKNNQVAELEHDVENKAAEIKTIENMYKSQIQQCTKDLLNTQEHTTILKKEASNRQLELDTYKQIQNEQIEELKNQKDVIYMLENSLKKKVIEVESLTQNLEDDEKIKQQQKAEIDQQKEIIVRLQNQFKQYRNHMNIISCERHNPCRMHVKELNQLLTELNRAKKFINEQAIYLDDLKSDIYQLNSRCKKTEQSLSEMNKDRLDQLKFYQSYYHGSSGSFVCSNQSYNETEHLQIQVNDTL